MTVRGLTGIHFLPQGQTLTADYYISNTLDKKVKPVLHRKNVNEATDKRKLFSSNRHMMFVQDGASTRSQGHPGMVQKQPVKLYKENMLAAKLPRYHPRGESLEHNGWSRL